jgi:hypothetical protein
MGLGIGLNSLPVRHYQVTKQKMANLKSKKEKNGGNVSAETPTAYDSQPDILTMVFYRTDQ